MSTFPSGPPSLLRTINVRAVLQLFAAGAVLTRADVAAASGLSRPTVSAALGYLTDHGLLAEVGQISGRKGPAAQVYRLTPTAFLAVGIDIGTRQVRLGVVDAHGAQRIGLTAPTLGDVAGIAEQLGGLADQAAAGLGVPRAAFVRTVIGVPGVVGPVGVPGVVGPVGVGLRYAGGLPGEGAGLIEALRDVFGEEVVLENDLNLSAIVEGRGGAARGVEDFVLIGLSSGIGMGVVLNGRLYRGASGAAGEIGFIPSPEEATRELPGPLPWRPRIDDVLGTQRIMDQARARGIDDAADPIRVFDLARAGDPRALDVVDDTARTLAWLIAAIVPVLDPRLVVLGGAVGADDLLAGPLRQHLGEVCPITPDVVASAFGSQAVLLGALAVAEDLSREVAFARVSTGEVPSAAPEPPHPEPPHPEPPHSGSTPVLATSRRSEESS